MFKGVAGPLVLVVLDGVGEIPRETGNAVRLARMPFWNGLKPRHRYTTLRAHGTAVGLPSDGDMGNSEVGHNALGAGQVYQQGAKLVNNAIQSGHLFEAAAWRTAVGRLAPGRGTLHFIGLLSDGNVHSHIRHLFAMLRQAAQENVQRVRVHALLDGRDVDGTSAHLYVDRLETELAALNERGLDYRIASGGGRMKITMDRYGAEWGMVEAGWKHHVLGQGRGFPNALEAIHRSRDEQPGILDQDLPGFVIVEKSGPVGPIRDGDSVIFFNFRGDRAVEISRCFDEGQALQKFDRVRIPDIFYAGMMQYDGDLLIPKNYLVGPPTISHTLTELLVDYKLTQFAISETQKYGHVTYFWNGNRSGKLDPAVETFMEIRSDSQPCEQRPWMKAAEITDALIEAIRSGAHRFLRVNYANGDMVGHTGNLEASILAMSCIDIQLQRLLLAVARAGGAAIITADHGNCDEMIQFDQEGRPVIGENGAPKPKTSHSLSPVPFLLYDPHRQVPAVLRQASSSALANVAATVVELLGRQAPDIWQPSLLQWSS